MPTTEKWLLAASAGRTGAVAEGASPPWSTSGGRALTCLPFLARPPYPWPSFLVPPSPGAISRSGSPRRLAAMPIPSGLYRAGVLPTLQYGSRINSIWRTGSRISAIVLRTTPQRSHKAGSGGRGNKAALQEVTSRDPHSRPLEKGWWILPAQISIRGNCNWWRTTQKLVVAAQRDESKLAARCMLGGKGAGRRRSMRRKDACTNQLAVLGTRAAKPAMDAILLIADNDVRRRDELRRFFWHSGFTVDFCGDGLRCLAKLLALGAERVGNCPGNPVGRRRRGDRGLNNGLAIGSKPLVLDDGRCARGDAFRTNRGRSL